MYYKYEIDIGSIIDEADSRVGFSIWRWRIIPKFRGDFEPSKKSWRQS